MPRDYPIFPLPDPPQRTLIPEVMGSKEKVWLRHLHSGRYVMLKLAREGSGEDWSEKVAYEIARLLGVPCPRVELARSGQRDAVLCWDFLGRTRAHGAPFSLVHGNELLLQKDPDYPTSGTYEVSEHTIGAVAHALRGLGHRVRPAVLASGRDAFSAFVGYLLLDALIGNTDRHHENWAVVSGPGAAGAAPVTLLSPSYDHASSLGRELSDEKRARRLGGAGRGTLEDYAKRAVSAFWADDKSHKLTPLQALAAAGTRRAEAFSVWLGRLHAISTDRLAAVIERVPAGRLSALGKRFTLELLRYNRAEILKLS